MNHLTPLKIFVAGIGFICIAIALYAVVRMDTSSVTTTTPVESQGMTDWIPLTSRDGALSLKVPPTFEVSESQAFSATTRFAQSLGASEPYADSLNLMAHGLTDECSLVGDSGTSTETIGAQNATFYVVRTDMGGSGNTGNRWVQVRYVHPVSATSCVAVSAAHMWSYTSATVSATTTEGIQQRKENAIVDAAFDKLLPQIIGTAFISATSTTESVADWKTYTSTKYDYSFQYPAAFGTPKEYAGTPSKLNSYDTVVFLDGRLAVHSGVSYNLSTSQPIPFSWFSQLYETKEYNKKQITIGGKNAIQVSNSQIGTNTLIPLSNDAIIIIIGSLDLQNQILPTFRFNP